MSVFSHPTANIAFHLGDILGVISLGQYKPLIDTPPMRMDGTFFPARQYPVEGIIQLAEYVTGEEVPLRPAPNDSGQMEFNNRWLLVLTNQAGAQLIIPQKVESADSLPEFVSRLIAHTHPYEKVIDQLRSESPPSLGTQHYTRWLQAKAQEIGTYFIVPRMRPDDKEYLLSRKRDLGIAS